MISISLEWIKTFFSQNWRQSVHYNKDHLIFTYQLVVTVVMKNWDPFVSLPALAMDKRPDPTTSQPTINGFNKLNTTTTTKPFVPSELG